MKNLLESLRALCRCRIESDFPLAALTTVKIGGPAEIYIEPDSVEDIQNIVRAALQSNASITMIGGGSNVLISDEGVAGIVMHLKSKAFNEFYVDDDFVRCGSAMRMSRLLPSLVQNGFGDCDFLLGVPAQLGGAIMMNAGSGSRWIGSYIDQIKVVNAQGELIDIQGQDCGFAYRHSALKGNIIVSAKLKFPKVDPAITRATMDAYNAYRQKTQDLKYPNLGCMFTNPDSSHASAGQLIDEAGLKGYQVGGAKVSDVHANFLINVGDASEKDVLTLLRVIQDKVMTKHGIHLKPEMQHIQ